MIGKMTDEAIRAVINNAPEGAEYWTYGYVAGYRKLILGCVFGWLPDDERWVRAIDNDIAMERVDKGFWIPNLVKELDNRQLIPQTDTEIAEEKEVEREELEAAYDLCCTFNENDFVSAEEFKNYHPSLCDKWLLIVRKTGYRKESEL